MDLDLNMAMRLQRRRDHKMVDMENISTGILGANRRLQGITMESGR